MIEVTLPSGGSVKCHPLPIFGLADGVDVIIPPPFTIKTKVLGGEKEEVFYAEGPPPKRPETPENETKEGGQEWYDWLQYHAYHAAIAHQYKIGQAVADYCLAIRKLVLSRVDKPDLILNESDYLEVYAVVVFREVTWPDIVDCANNFFKAAFDGEGLFDATEQLPRSGSEVDSLKMWIVRTISERGVTEHQWSMLPYRERVRTIAASMIPKLLESLENHKAHEDAKRSRHG